MRESLMHACAIVALVMWTSDYIVNVFNEHITQYTASITLNM